MLSIANTPALIGTSPTQETKVEYEWEIPPSDLACLLLEGQILQLHSPRFFGGLDDCLWQLGISVKPQNTSHYLYLPKDVYISLTLVSIGSHNRVEQDPTNVSIRYEFKLSIANYEIIKSNAMETAEPFSAGDLRGIYLPFSVQYLRDMCCSYFRSTGCKLKLSCVIWIQNDVRKIKSTTDVLEDYVATRQFQVLATFMRSMLTDSSSADITLKVGDEAYQAHTCILAARSKVFAAMFGSDMTEARNRTVEIEDFEPDVVQAMLKYIYCGDITAAQDRPCDLLKIADKYELLDLKDECEKFIIPSLTVANAAQALMCAHEHNLNTLWPEIKNFVNRNRAAITKTDSFKEVVKQYPDILYDLYSSEEKYD